jgi:hypothetical protein
VSPQWRDELRAWVAPHEIRLVRVARGVRPSCVAEVTHAVRGPGVDWHEALADFCTLLDDRKWRAPLVRVVVSDLWARYAIVPWSDQLTNEDERLAHARICLCDTYGSTDDAWRICLSDSGFGKPRVACAVPEALLTALTAALTPLGMRLASVRPCLISKYNEWRLRLPQDSAWFVSVEEGSLAAARLVPDGWDRVYVARIGADWRRELLRLRTFARMAAMAGDNGRVFIHAPARLRRLAGTSDPGIEWLGSADEADASRAVAKPVGVPG